MPLRIRVFDKEILIPEGWVTKGEFDYLKDEPDRLIDMIVDSDPRELLELLGDPQKYIKIVRWEKK